MSITDSFNVLINAYNKMANEHCKNDAYNRITVAGYQYLAAIFEANSITITNLSDVLGVKKSSVTQMIESLIQKDYVRKSRNDQDKRSSLVELTEKGRTLMESENNIYQEFSLRISRGLTPQELSQFEVLLTKSAEAVQADEKTHDVEIAEDAANKINRSKL